MSKFFLKLPKGLNMLMLTVAGTLKMMFVSQMSFNATAIQLRSLGVESNAAGLVTTIIFTGIVYALIIRLFILIGYKIANRIHIKKTSPSDPPAERLLPIGYVEFRSIASGYMALAAFGAALLNIPMYLFPLSYMLCLLLGALLEVAAILIMVYDLQNILPPAKCIRAYNALIVPFAVIIVLRLLLGV